MPGAGSEHPMAAKICRVGEGASQEGVFGVLGVGDGVPSSPMGHPGLPGAKGTSLLSTDRTWQSVPGRPFGMAAWGSQSCTGGRGAFPSSEVLGIMVTRL